MQIARWLHLLGVVVGVGGMFFAHMALRPSVRALNPPERLTLLAATLTRFFAWAAVAVVAILGSGAWILVSYGGFGAVHWSIHAMVGIGVVVLIYIYLAVVPLRALRSAVAAKDWPRGGAAMSRIRQLVAVNLVLGIVTLTIASLGRR
jgi:uncharacterized membrane protein